MGAERPTFLFDVGSPWCWLAAERINQVLGEVPVWQPVLLPTEPVRRATVEARAAEQSLPAVRWPDPFPFDSRTAMLAAEFARQTGRVVAYSLAAMRQAFLAGRDLSVTDNVLIAAAACEVHPRALLAALEARAVRDGLESATERARGAGIGAVPAVVVGDATFSGADAVEAAAGHPVRS